jgi:hypothetical protein
METQLTTSREAARGGLVTIAVGPESVKYVVHRAVITEESEYFKKALKGPWKEAEQGIVRLEDVEPKICKSTLALTMNIGCSFYQSASL